MRKFLVNTTAVLALFASGGVGAAHASVILALVGDPTAVAGGFDYTYEVGLSQDEQLNPSVQTNFFTLYDFGVASLVGTTGILDDGDWTLALNENQATPAEGVLPNNNPSIDDVRDTYDGPIVLGSSLPHTDGNLGTFTLFTTGSGTFQTVDNDQDAQLVKESSGIGNDTPTSNLAAVSIPTVAAVPEPTTLALLGSGLIALGLVRRKRG